MPDLDRAIRKKNTQLGVEIILHKSEEGRPLSFSAVDPELGQTFTQFIQFPSTALLDLKQLAEAVYHARGREVYRRQKGLCAFCGRQMNGIAETDHIKSRGRYGRDDALSNLRSVCVRMAGGCNGHAVRHGQKNYKIRQGV